MKKIIFVLIVATCLYPWEIFIVANKRFPKNDLTPKAVKAIFLDKKRFSGGKKILAINYAFNDPLRECFERTVLKKSRRQLELYWLKAHYKGKRPPKVVKSEKMLLKYLQKVDMAVGYTATPPKEGDMTKILYKSRCE